MFFSPRKVENVQFNYTLKKCQPQFWV